jgi:hypothetical protein
VRSSVKNATSGDIRVITCNDVQFVRRMRVEKLNAQTPAQNPYKTASTTTLATFESPIIPRIKTAPQPADAVTMFAIPSEWAKNPGVRRPTKLDAFIMTS